MARRKQVINDANDSDTSYSPEDDDVFDRDDDSGARRRNYVFDDSDDSDMSYSPEDGDVLDKDHDSSTRRRNQVLDDSDDSDTASYSPEDDDVFDRDEAAYEDSDLETEITEPKIDVDDQVLLFDGNVHPPEYYRDAIENFHEADIEDGDYAPGTENLLDAIQEAWERFCFSVLRLRGDSLARQGFEGISVGRLRSFFDWLLNQKIGKNGRNKRGIKKKSSLETMWKLFRLVFEREVGEKLEAKMNRKMHKVLKKLAVKHELSSSKRVNRCMTIDDLKERLETTITTTEKLFDLGELRILAALFLLLIAPFGSRPTAILRLRFGDLRVILARDPEGGPHKLLARFSPEFTKTYLGIKDAKTFTLPETLFDPSLLLNAHVFLIGILFRHQVFRAKTLTSPRQLNELDIHPGENELPIPLKKDMGDVYLFRRAVKTLTGYNISKTEPISYGMMRSWHLSIGRLLGIDMVLYSLRYNAANEFDQSIHVSEALRNLALDHGNSDPFQKHYLGREICVDGMAIIRGERPQQALIKQACSVGHAKSKRRPIGLNSQQVASVNTHPTILKLRKMLDQLHRGSKQYVETTREIRNEKKRLKRALEQKILDEWTDDQAVDDIERQLSGLGFAEQPDLDRSNHAHGPAQKRLINALLAPVETTLEGHYERRNKAIEEVIAYCFIEEGRTKRRSNASAHKTAQPSHADEPSPEHPAFQSALSVFVDNEKDRPKRCFLCVGKALSLAPDDPNIVTLIYEFFGSTDLTKHFKRKHLKNIRKQDKIYCHVCNIELDHEKHLQNHARLIHGTVS